MKHPFLPVTLLFAGGILVGDSCSLPLSFLFGIALVLAWSAVFWRAGRYWILWPLILLTGWSNLAWHTATLSPHDLRRLLKDSVDLVAVRGVLREAPDWRRVEQGEEASWRTRAVLEVETIRQRGTWRPASGRVQITVPEKITQYFGGQILEVFGVIQRPSGKTAPGLFDYRHYLRRHRIYYLLRTKGADDWRLVETADQPIQAPFSERFLAWARKSLARGLPEEDESLRLRWAMTLGWRSALSDEMSKPFIRSGTMHIFAISGLHVALIAGIVIKCLQVMGGSRRGCGWVVIPLLWFYTGATGWQPSAVRATVMMSVVIAGWALKRPPDLLNSVAAAAFLILVWDPQQMFLAGFQLSFGVVVTLALLVPVFDRVRQDVWSEDPFLPVHERAEWRRRLDRPVRYLSGAVATSLAAWIGALPLVAWYFHLVTPVSLGVNLMIIPLSGLTLASSLGSLVCETWMPALTELFNHSGWFWMECMRRLSQWAAELPGAYFYVPGVPAVLIGVYYLTVYAVFTGWWRRTGRLKWCALGCGLILVTGVVRHQAGSGMLQLTVLAVSSGDAIWIDEPGPEEDFLVDCGNDSGVDFVVIPFLRGHGLDALPRLVLTHGDVYHVGGGQRLLEEMPVREVVTSPVRFRSRAYRELVEHVTGRPVPIREVERGDTIGRWVVLHPGAESSSRADDNAMVLRGECHGTRILLLSDLGRQGQGALLENNLDLRADILVTSVPRGEPPVPDMLLKIIRPSVLIVHSGNYPAQESIDPRLQERLRRYSFPVIYTRETGSALIRVHASGWEAGSMNGPVYRGHAAHR